MNLDERLPDLLARGALQADTARPTMDGVRSAIGRRARRRANQRRVGAALAALSVLAGIAGGLALASRDGRAVDPTDRPTLPASALGLPTVTRSVDEGGEHLTIEFDGVPPALGARTLLETLSGDCARFEAGFERIFQEGGGEPYWQGWLTVEIDSPLIGIAGPVFDVPTLGDAEEPGYILCNDGEIPAVIAVPVANLGEPVVTPLSGRPAVLIDIPVG